jgi:hypothetical protein
VKNIRLGTMSLPNSVASGTRKIVDRDAQSNTMLCKGKMNLLLPEKKWREAAGAVPATMPGIFGGRAPGKTDSLYHNAVRGQQQRQPVSVSRTKTYYRKSAATKPGLSFQNPEVTAEFVPASFSLPDR